MWAALNCFTITMEFGAVHLIADINFPGKILVRAYIFDQFNTYSLNSLGLLNIAQIPAQLAIAIFVAPQIQWQLVEYKTRNISFYFNQFKA